MCNISHQEISPGDLDIFCSISGKPITITDNYGMWCEDKCEYEKSVEAQKMILEVLDKFFLVK